MTARLAFPIRGAASVLVVLASMSSVAFAQSSSDVTPVSLPQAGEPMVIVPEAEPAKPERRGLGLFAPFRRNEARRAAPLPTAPLPGGETAPSVAAPESEPVAPPPSTADIAPLPPTRPMSVAAPVQRAAPQAAPIAEASVLEVEAQPGVSVEIANERALDEAAVRAAASEAARKVPTPSDGSRDDASEPAADPAVEPVAAIADPSQSAQMAASGAVVEVPLPREKPTVPETIELDKDGTEATTASEVPVMAEPGVSGEEAIAVFNETAPMVEAADHSPTHEPVGDSPQAPAEPSGAAQAVPAGASSEAHADGGDDHADRGDEKPVDDHAEPDHSAELTSASDTPSAIGDPHVVDGAGVHSVPDEQAASDEKVSEASSAEVAHASEHAVSDVETDKKDMPSAAEAVSVHADAATETATEELAQTTDHAAGDGTTAESRAPASDEAAHGETAHAATDDAHATETGHKEDAGPDDGSRAVAESHDTPSKGENHGGDGHGDDVPPAAPIEQAPRLAQTEDAGSALAPPYQLVRTLQALQDDIAHGSTGALTAQKVLLSRMDGDLLAADPAVWQEKRNAEALVVYTLSGGRPAVTRQLLEHDPLPNVDERLLRGALAYVQGREDDARKYLGDVDPLTLPVNLAGQVALAKSTLVVANDPEEAIRLLDLARLLSPGTLIEEAALRREIYVVSERNDIDKFESLSRQYLRRFQHSVYAGNFRQRFAAALTRMSFVDDPIQFERLHALLADLDADSQRELYLLVARAAVNDGKTAVAAMASERALSDAAPGSRDQARALLYRGAALAVMPEGLQSAIDDLGAVDRTLLAPSDAALFDAASATADLILTAPDGTEVVEATTTETLETVFESEVVAKATSMVDQVDALLNEVE
ncbi:hypothetical protein [Amorphus sp. 3PC139-8]|uniref:hypothetical protein n=1 Tax=Amorphus sp. 3PC139-8 TaxID=2735676 RepID=UPI00345CB490